MGWQSKITALYGSKASDVIAAMSASQISMLDRDDALATSQMATFNTLNQPWGATNVAAAFDREVQSAAQSAISGVKPTSVTFSSVTSAAVPGGTEILGNVTNGFVVGNLTTFDRLGVDNFGVHYTLQGNTGGAFAISGNKIVVANAAALTGNQFYGLQVVATDEFGQSIWFSAPIMVDHGPGKLTVSGNGSVTTGQSNAYAATVQVQNYEPNAQLTYKVLGAAAADFTFSGSNLVTSHALADSAGGARTVSVQVSDQFGMVSTADYAVEVLGAPIDLSLSSTTLAASAKQGTVVGSVSVTDPSQHGAFQYRLSGGDTGRFTMSGNNLVVGWQGPPAGTDTVTITAMDSATGKSFSKTITLQVGDTAPVPPVLQSGVLAETLTQATRVLEHLAAGQIVGVLSATDKTAGATMTYSIVGGADASHFKVVGNTLVTADVLPDLGVHDYAVTVRATDSYGKTFDQALVVHAVEPTSTVSALSLSGLVAAGEVAGAVVGTLSATDAIINPGLTYSITGGTNAADFAVANGQIVTSKALIYLDGATRSVTVQASDMFGAKTSQTFTVGVADVAPTSVTSTQVGTPLEHQAAGMVVGTLSGVDPDARDVLILSVVGGADAAMFKVVGNQLVTTGTLPDLGAHDFQVTVRATDIGGKTFDQAILVHAVEPTSSITGLALSASLAAGEVAGAVVGTLSATDSVANPGLAYSIVGGVNAADFAIANGQLVTSKALDYLDGATRSVTVQAADMFGTKATQTFSVAVADLAPTSLTATSMGTVLEHQAAGLVVATLSGTDPDPRDVLTFSIAGGADAALFKVVGNQLVTAGALPDLGVHDFTVAVRATDIGGLSVTKTVTVHAIESLVTQVSFSGGTVAGEQVGAVVGTLSTADLDPTATFHYTLGGADASLFNVVGGQLVTAAALNYLDGPRSVTVTSTDNWGSSATTAVAVTVKDAAPTSVGFTQVLAPVYEHQPAGVVVGAVAGVDPDARDTLTYSISGGSAAALFTMSGASVVTAVSLPSYTDFDYQITLRATDRAGFYTDKAVTVHVLAPLYSVTSEALSSSTVSGERPAGAVVGHMSAVDSNSAAHITFAVTGGAQAANFAVDANGYLVTTAPLHYILGNEDVVVTASDNHGTSLAQHFSVHVTDAFAPSALALNAGLPITSNSLAGSALGRMVTTDGDVGDTFTYKVAGGTDASLFTLDAAGTLILTAQAGFNHGVARDVIVQSTDAGGLSIIQDLKIHVQGVAPTDIAPTGGTIADGAAAGTVVSTLSALGLDPTDTATFSLLQGSASGLFAVSGNNLILKSGVTYAGTGGSLDLTVRATEMDGASVDKALHFNVSQPVVVGGSVSNLHLDNYSVREAMPIGEIVGKLGATDSAGHALAYSIVGGANASDFGIDALGNLFVTTSFNGANTEAVNIKATDDLGLSTMQAFTIQVIKQNQQYGSGPVSSDPSLPNLFGSDGGVMQVFGFNENLGDNLSFSLLFPQGMITKDFIKLYGTDAGHIEIQITDGVQFQHVYDLENAISADGILQGHGGAISQGQLDTLMGDWLSHNTIHA